MSQPMHGTWRMIIATVFMSLLVMAASFAALRAGAQQSPPPEASAPQEQEQEQEQQIEAPAQSSDQAPDETAPDLQMSADSNISFPVDI